MDEQVNPTNGAGRAPTYEKLGAFYLGRARDAASLDPVEGDAGLLLYDSRDLTTHAVCVGMTGSGKTGLCLGLLEEALLDGVPAIAIDPKGDLGNLLLTFPDLSPGEFRPWIDEAEAARKGMTPDEFAADRAALWKNGLAGWGIGPARIAQLRETVDMAIYTPGSSAGLPLAILKKLTAPPEAVREDADALREHVGAAVSGLLALLGIEADPVRSREHILLATILDGAWRAGRDLDLAGLIGAIQTPGFDTLGVMDLDSFFPAKDRFELALSLNNLLASPGFAPWMQGEGLDISRLLYTDDAKPRCSIVSIAHLNDQERMFFVTILLSEVIAWMRAQPGTSSLRAILYMDEIYGYFPPTKNPPSKQPMLTLLKQARAYGLGVVLATQNPVDLDYKGLSNTGTWFLGRLQTERDKLRIIDGLEGAAASSGTSLDRKRLDTLLSGLGSRRFLMNNVHDAEPVLFETRWAMSYLRGPLTRSQIGKLMEGRSGGEGEEERHEGTEARRHEGGKDAGHSDDREARETSAPAESASPGVGAGAGSGAPVLAPDVPQVWLGMVDGVGGVGGVASEGERIEYRACLVGVAQLHYVRTGADIDEWRPVTMVAPLTEKTAHDPWDHGRAVELSADGVRAGRAVEGAAYADVPAPATDAKTYRKWERLLVDHLYRSRTEAILHAPEFKTYSALGEDERTFRIRLRELAHEKRDRDVNALQQKYVPKLAALQDRVRKAEQKLAKEEGDVTRASVDTAVSVGSTILGALFGRKVGSVRNVGRASTAARAANRREREKDDVERARADLEASRKKVAELEAEFETELAEVRSAAAGASAIETIDVRPRKSDTAVKLVALAWTPWIIGADGTEREAWARR